MKNTDLMIIGALTKDENIDYTQKIVHEIGGAVFFSSHAASITNCNVHAVVKMNPDDQILLENFPAQIEITMIADKHTTLMQNIYYTSDRERRKSTCLSRTEAIHFASIPTQPCKIYHLAGLLSGDFDDQLIVDLAQKGQVSIDAQGYLRHNENGTMIFRDWEDKRKYLPFLQFLKTDAAEAEILTGLSDRFEAAKQLYRWGAKEILITHHQEVLVFDGKECFTSPLTPKNLSGRTGRGDTTMGAYLGMRSQDVCIKESLDFAAAAVSLKMEEPGPLTKSKKMIEEYRQKRK